MAEPEATSLEAILFKSSTLTVTVLGSSQGKYTAFDTGKSLALSGSNQARKGRLVDA